MASLLNYSVTCLNRNLTNPDICLNRLCWKVPANSLYISMYLILSNLNSDVNQGTIGCYYLGIEFYLFVSHEGMKRQRFHV